MRGKKRQSKGKQQSVSFWLGSGYSQMRGTLHGNVCAWRLRAINCSGIRRLLLQTGPQELLGSEGGSYSQYFPSFWGKRPKEILKSDDKESKDR